MMSHHLSSCQFALHASPPQQNPCDATRQISAVHCQWQLVNIKMISECTRIVCEHTQAYTGCIARPRSCLIQSSAGYPRYQTFDALM